ncbi:MAG: phosphonate ABC transporter substrate-binding protein [Sheuella sp.]|nr:phosphonate ABC transporter substrate-binding protein [Sheuella sp.]
MIKKILFTSILGFTMMATSQIALAEDINFGFISTESSQNLKAEWQPILDALQKQTGLTVKAFFASDYAGIIEGMRFNKVQVAWFGNKSAMEAVDRSNGEVFAQKVNADGSLGYTSHLIVNKASNINNIDDMFKVGKSISFGNGDPNSTSGYLVPGFYVFAQNKIDPKTFFKVVRGANHETNALAVANKQVDVATNNSENLNILKKRAPEKFDQIKIIWTSPLIPLDPLVMRKDLPEATKKKIKDFFFNYGTTNPEEQAVLVKMGNLKGFKESTDAQLIPIRQLELFSQRNKIEADTILSDNDKKAKTAEIDVKLEALKK